MRTLLHALLFLVVTASVQAQTITGTLLDAQSEMPLIGATVEVLDVEPALGTTTDFDGRFVLAGVALGRQSLRLSYIGYEPRVVPNVVVTAGKDVVLNLSLEEAFTQLETAVVVARTDPAATNNELSEVSTRSFTAEQVNRFAGGRSDVSRLATNFAGVATADDSRNDIVVRGNSPTGVLWQLEGVPIPNPNHFSTLGTTGGPVSALNTNLIGASDFSTSAFAAEYGNALSGVFDLGLRRGNRERHEFMGQLGTFTGLEALAEGPMGGKGSYVVGFRNSFVGFADAIGVPLGTAATPDYRDLTFNLDFGNGKLGKFSVFGIGATSKIDFLANEVDSTDLFANAGRNSYPRSQFGVLGVRHNLILNDRTYLRTIISGSYQGNTYDEYDVSETGADQLLLTAVEDDQRRTTLKSYVNSKVNRRLTIRSGVQLDLTQLTTVFDDRDGSPDRDGDGLRDLDRIRDFDGTFTLGQVFAQARYKLTERLTANAGLHAQYFDINEAFALEPRLALSAQATDKLKLTLGYGRHSQTPALPVFLFRDVTTGEPSGNESLGFLKADHYVLAADYAVAPKWRIKGEVYYQSLFDVPVDASPSSFSLLNAGADFVFPERGSLVSEGTGENYGFELTVEHFFADNWYLLATGSVFESTYEGSDGIERNTAFNNRYVGNLLGGKEWPFGKTGKNRFTVSGRITGSGGRYYSPVDVELSREFNTDIRDDQLAFSERYAAYFRADLKFGVQINSSKRRLSQSWFIDFQNVTNRENVFQERFNPATGEVNTVYQSGFFPDVQWRITF